MVGGGHGYVMVDMVVDDIAMEKDRFVNESTTNGVKERQSTQYLSEVV